MMNIVLNGWSFVLLEIAGLFVKIREMLGSFEMAADPYGEGFRIALLVVFILVIDLIILPETEDR